MCNPVEHIFMKDFKEFVFDFCRVTNPNKFLKYIFDFCRVTHVAHWYAWKNSQLALPATFSTNALKWTNSKRQFQPFLHCVFSNVHFLPHVDKFNLFTVIWLMPNTQA